MSRKRLMITGASGFVGGYLVDAITKSYSDNLDLIDFLDPETNEMPDICDRDAIDRTMKTTQPDAVIHLAAMSIPRQAKENLGLAWDVNLTGTLNIAKAIMQFAPNARLIWTGSSESYGLAFNKHPLPIDESAALEPANAYGATKAAADMMLTQMAMDGLNAVICRPFNHTGPGQIPSLVVPAFASQVAKIELGLQKPVLEVGNLLARRDFLDVRDVVDAYIKAAIAEEIAPGTRYNISTGSPIQIGEILNKLIACSEADISVQISPDRYVENVVPTASGNITAIKRDLGWQPAIPFDQTLTEVLDDQRRLCVAEMPQ